MKHTGGKGGGGSSKEGPSGGRRPGSTSEHGAGPRSASSGPHGHASLKEAHEHQGHIAHPGRKPGSRED